MNAQAEDSVEDDWDAIVIGSGLAGMTTAVGLARSGRRVLVLEQHNQPGGYATSFRRKGFTFEVSLHQLPGLGTGQPLHRILSDLGVFQKIQPVALPETMRIHTRSGEISMGPGYIEELKRRFPAERAALDRLDRTIASLLKETETAMRLSVLPRRVLRLVGRFATPTLYRLRNETLSSFLDSNFSDGDLKELIAVQWGYFGLPPRRISAILYFIGWGGFLKQGIYYLKGTSQSLSDAFVETLRECGGRILLSTIAEEILTGDGRVYGVRARFMRGLNRNQSVIFRAPIVISNADPFVTLDHLIVGSAAPGLAAYRALLHPLEASASATVAYIGLDCPLADLTHRRDVHSFGFFPDGPDAPQDSDALYAAILKGDAPAFAGLTDYSSIDPSLAPAGKSTIVVLQTDVMRNWAGLAGEAYARKKADVATRIVASMDERFPGFATHIEVIEIGTPRTMRRYTLNSEGAFNGFAYTPERVGMCDGGIPPRTPVRGLYLSSAWVGAFSGGYMGCIATGYAIAMQIKATARRPQKKPRGASHA